MLAKRLRKAFIFPSILSILLAACNVLPATPTATPTTPAPTSTTAPTNTAIPPTFTPLPTATHTPLPSLTPTALLLALEGTPLPGGLAPITATNANMVSGLAAWQESSVTDLAWAPEGDTLAVATYQTISLYDAATRTRISELDAPVE